MRAGDARLGVLVRLNLPTAREQVRVLLGQKNQNFLIALVGQIGESVHDENTMPSSLDQGERRLRAPHTLSESLVPELVHLAFTSHSIRVRQSAQGALSQIAQLSGIPSEAGQLTKWKNGLRIWWQRNASRLKRSPSLADSF